MHPSAGNPQAEAPSPPLPWDLTPVPGMKSSYGGVVVDPTGRILLREVANHFDGYVWSFAKGVNDPGETPQATALREVFEETGVHARIARPIPGDFRGGTSITRYFLMTATPNDDDPPFSCRETARVEWVTPDEARKRINLTRNATGRARDLKVLEAALALLS